MFDAGDRRRNAATPALGVRASPANVSGGASASGTRPPTAATAVLRAEHHCRRACDGGAATPAHARPTLSARCTSRATLDQLLPAPCTPRADPVQLVRRRARGRDGFACLAGARDLC